MANTSRQTAIFGIEDWKRLYQTYREADFQSYNFETLRKSFIDYLRQYYPESFNDFVESSEFVAMLDLIAFMGQSLAFRTDLNSRENFLDTAERRDSVVNLAKLVGYTPKRNLSARGYLKVTGISTTESVLDYNRNNLANRTIRWNDRTNPDWQEQFKAIVNAIVVNSQAVGNPGNEQTLQGVKTQEYTINTTTGIVPAVPFDATVDGVSMPFEIISATSVNKTYIYEPAPRANGDFNMLYRNDNLGFGSKDTGYFFYFKQGSLQSRDFNLSERLANRTVDINIDGVNDDDIWLYKLNSRTQQVNEQWTEVENIYGSSEQQTNTAQRKLFSVTSRANDQITLNFGDGVFAEIPVGAYRAYTRSSNGLQYVINPEEMQSITVSISYVSRRGRTETATFTLGLQENVSNSRARESLADIKRRAPARFYTQNRMVNGEDYNNFPYTQFSSIIKSKAVMRTNIGASRFLDLVDPTGKYSSINTYGADGAIYRKISESSFGFTFVDTNDINNVIINQVEPTLSSQPMLHFYYDQYNRKDLTTQNLSWVQSTTTANQTTGYFVDSNSNPATIGSGESNNKQFLDQNCLVKFTAPSGYYFDRNRRLQLGTPTGSGDSTYVWASIKSLIGDGTNEGEGNDLDGVGPVTLNDFVPSNSVVDTVIPVFDTNLPVAIEQSIIEQVELYREFGLGYNYDTGSWYIIAANNLDADGDFSLSNAGDTSNTGIDASWLVKFSTDGSSYTVTSRTLNYYFTSVVETRFFYDNNQLIYDPKTGKTVNDFIKVLKTNSQPDSNSPLAGDITLDIIGQTIEADGFVNDFTVEVSFNDIDQDGIPSDPDFFDSIVAPSVNSNNKLVFFERTVDFDNLERYLPLSSDIVVTSYATENAINLAKAEYSNGQVFYATAEQKFFVLTVSNNTKTISESTDYSVNIGRSDLQFQYKHNSPDTRRINPGATNIIDTYLVTADYYTAYTRWIQDSTNTVSKPAQPTTAELATAYQTLDDYKMMSDNLILSSVNFKPLFGSKAETSLQADIKVVKLDGTVVSNSEIKSRVVNAINTYFNIDNWDFGDTFYFSELAAYLHEELGSSIGSVVLLPKDTTQGFGKLYQVNSAPNEIFISSATVNDIEIIDALTASQLRITNTNGVV
jgi:hypothetical protein